MSEGDDIISPIEAVQNSALGAFLLWQFGRAYREHSGGAAPMLHLAFLLLPLVLHRWTLEKVSGTYPSSGLGKFAEKFGNGREELLAIHDRTRAMRTLTLEALSTGIATGLLEVDYGSATFRSNVIKLRPPNNRIKLMSAAAAKLGQWMARVPPATVFSLLQVRP